jgi:hypothetical protein
VRYARGKPSHRLQFLGETQFQRQAVAFDCLRFDVDLQLAFDARNFDDLSDVGGDASEIIPKEKAEVRKTVENELYGSKNV